MQSEEKWTRLPRGTVLAHQRAQRRRAVEKILRRDNLKPWPLRYWAGVLEKLPRSRTARSWWFDDVVFEVEDKPN